MKEAAKYATALLVVLAAGFGFVHMQEQKGYGLKVGSPAPGFRLPRLAGADVDLGSLRGRVAVVNFWATWCPPCVDEMPSLERLHRALGPEGLTVVGISTDEDGGVLTGFVRDKRISFPILRDPGGRVASAEYHTTGYPETFVIDPKGVLVEIYVGPTEWDTPSALDHFRGLLKSFNISPTR
jgi:peroxiredoxin